MTLKSFSDPTSTEARQFLLDRRNERAHPKRHRTIGRRRRLAKAKKQASKLRLAGRDKARSKFLALAKAYWTGKSPTHPTEGKNT